MKVIVSTKKKQGMRKNDFCYVPENELLKCGNACDGEKIDGSCGCKRSFIGMKCQKATTTFKVVDKKMTKERYIQTLYNSEVKTGFTVINLAVRMHAETLLELAKTLEPGKVYEKRGSEIKQRK